MDKLGLYISICSLANVLTMVALISAVNELREVIKDGFDRKTDQDGNN